MKKITNILIQGGQVVAQAGSNYMVQNSID